MCRTSLKSAASSADNGRRAPCFDRQKEISLVTANCSGVISGNCRACSQRRLWPIARDAGEIKPATAAKAVEQPSAESAVELKTLDYDGILLLVESKHGQVVVMDAWSTSCALCVKEFPQLVELHKRYGAQGVACISLSFDYDGESVSPLKEVRGRVLGFLREQGATFDNVISSDDTDVLYRKFHLASVPAVFVYDRQGQLRKRFDNVLRQEQGGNVQLRASGSARGRAFARAGSDNEVNDPGT